MNKPEIDSSGWNKAQIPEILSDENKWYTGEEVGHEPSTNECVEHYAECGGAAHFAKTHKIILHKKR